MLTGIHQPQFLPWLGYFDKINTSDIFIFLDDVQFKKNEWQNRNRIRTAQGCQWLTVPVIHNFGQLIKEVQINNTIDWRKNHLTTLEQNYRKAPFFEQYFPIFENIYHQEWDLLSELNMTIILKLINEFNITTKIVKSSDFTATDDKTQRLVDLCKAVDGTTYFSGADGYKYMELEKFDHAKISITAQDFIHPIYPQLRSTDDKNDFISHLSIIDLIFNCGPNTLPIIEGKEVIHENSN